MYIRMYIGRVIFFTILHLERLHGRTIMKSLKISSIIAVVLSYCQNVTINKAGIIILDSPAYTFVIQSTYATLFALKLTLLFGPVNCHIHASKGGLIRSKSVIMRIFSKP